MKKISKLVAKHERVIRLEKGEHLDAERRNKVWGVIRSVGGQKNVTVLRSSRFAKLVSPPAVAAKVLEKLGADGRLVKSPTGQLKCQILITELTEKRHRYVCIRGLVKKRPKLPFNVLAKSVSKPGGKTKKDRR